MLVLASVCFEKEERYTFVLFGQAMRSSHMNDRRIEIGRGEEGY